MKQLNSLKIAVLLGSVFALSSCAENYYDVNAYRYRTHTHGYSSSGGGGYAPNTGGYGGYIKPAEGENINFRGASE